MSHIVFRIPPVQSLQIALASQGFSFLKLKNDSLVAYNANHWLPGPHKNIGLALESDLGLRPTSPEALSLLEAPFNRRQFMKGALAAGAIGALSPLSQNAIDTTDMSYVDTVDSNYGYGYGADLGDMSYADIGDSQYVSDSTYDTSDTIYGYANENKGLSVMDLEDLSDSWNRLHPDYETTVLETIKKCLGKVGTPKINQLTQEIHESRDRLGNVKILLDEGEHIEWSVMQKLTKAFDSHVTKRNWSSPIEKLSVLCRESRGGIVRGVPAFEALTVGGNKHLMWVDIDAIDTSMVESWLKTQTIFPKDSFKAVKSTTGKTHLYVVTNVPLKERWQRRMRRMIRESMPVTLRRSVDRVYGPESKRVIFLPSVSLLEATLPQLLVAETTGALKISIDRVEDRLWKILRSGV